MPSGKLSADAKVILLQQSLLTYVRELTVVCVHCPLTAIDVISQSILSMVLSLNYVADVNSNKERGEFTTMQCRALYRKGNA